MSTIVLNEKHVELFVLFDVCGWNRTEWNLNLYWTVFKKCCSKSYGCVLTSTQPWEKTVSASPQGHTEGRGAHVSTGFGKTSILKSLSEKILINKFASQQDQWIVSPASCLSKKWFQCPDTGWWSTEWFISDVLLWNEPSRPHGPPGTGDRSAF